MCVVVKAGFEPRTLGTEAERATNCATAPVVNVLKSMSAFYGSVTIIFCPAHTSPCPLLGGVFKFCLLKFDIFL